MELSKQNSLLCIYLLSSFFLDQTYLELLRGEFQFLMSPKKDLDVMKLALISIPKNFSDALAFCETYATNGTIYYPDETLNETIAFAQLHNIYQFYVGLTDRHSEGTFTYLNGTVIFVVLCSFTISFQCVLIKYF